MSVHNTSERLGQTSVEYLILTAVVSSIIITKGSLLKKFLTGGCVKGNKNTISCKIQDVYNLDDLRYFKIYK